MSAAASRRGFLHGLVSLPLIGGGVTLIGAPTAVAAPVTDALFTAYRNFIVHEHREVLAENAYRRALVRADELFRTQGLPMPVGWPDVVAQDTRELPHLHWTPKASDRQKSFCEATRPSSRAALVLAAIGCDWQEGDQ